MTHLMILFACLHGHCQRVDAYPSQECDAYWMKAYDSGPEPEGVVTKIICADLTRPCALSCMTINTDQRRMRQQAKPITWGPRT